MLVIAVKEIPGAGFGLGLQFAVATPKPFLSPSWLNQNQKNPLTRLPSNSCPSKLIQTARTNSPAKAWLSHRKCPLKSQGYPGTWDPVPTLEEPG